MLPPEYLRGIELFNRGEFFACHEVLEELWQAAAGEQRLFLHALIQTAAALHHYQRGNYRGARSVWRRARQKLLQLPPVMMMLETAGLQQQTDILLAPAENSSDNLPAAPLPQIRLVDRP